MGHHGRRAFIAGAAASFLPLRAAIAENAPVVRNLSFENLHTGERLTADYWADGRYEPQALEAVNHILRDFRTGDVHPIDPKLLDLLVTVRAKLDSTAPITVISGYRSPATNAMLHAEREHSGVAVKSLHMQGMAIDLRIVNRSLEALHAAALAQQSGGVGYYPDLDFVHVDVGRVRYW